MKRVFGLSIVGALIIVGLATAGVTQALGAHPRWAFDVAVYGAVPGVLLALGLSRAGRFGPVIAASDLILAGGVVWWGKRAFVASSGDDAFAGYLWFYGWIAVCACSVAVLALAADRLFRRVRR